MPPVLIKRLKQHFCTLAAHQVDIVLGCNGWVWVQARQLQHSSKRIAIEAHACSQEARAQQSDARLAAEHPDADAAAVAASAAAARPEDAPDAWDAEAEAGPVCASFSAASRSLSDSLPWHAAAEARERICRIAAAVRVLSQLFLAIYPASIVSVADAALAWGVSPRDMSGAAFLQRIADRGADLAADD